MHHNKSHKPVTALGLMSGTSLDGVDIALIETDGQAVQRFGPCGARPFTADERALLRTTLDDARQITARHQRPGTLADAETMITQAYAEAINRFLTEHNIACGRIAVAGVHGQTVLHRPARGLTVQLIDAEALSQCCGLPVVHDLRGADIAAGGQGAPLVPAYHGALAHAAGMDLPAAVLNVGGVANVTWIGADGGLIAFDTGPGNALLDDWALRHTGEAMDRDGRLAARGTPAPAALAALESALGDYLTRKPPKSLDRLDFRTGDALDRLSPEDGAATLVDYTARCIARASDHLPAPLNAWIVTGGGARNPAVMRALAATLPAAVRSGEDLGWRGDFIEAQAFAFLAVRSLYGLPITFPGTTGAPAAMTGGRLIRPERTA
jgi:anhydro-N-acetylmuramic acid kinase